MDISQFMPLAVIGAAIAVTELYKKVGFIKPEIIAKTIWLPALIVGIVGAILLGIDKEPWNIIAWNAITYAAGASYIVLIAKRTIK